jgi:hypothetical protein
MATESQYIHVSFVKEIELATLQHILTSISTLENIDQASFRWMYDAPKFCEYQPEREAYNEFYNEIEFDFLANYWDSPGWLYVGFSGVPDTDRLNYIYLTGFNHAGRDFLSDHHQELAHLLKSAFEFKSIPTTLITTLDSLYRTPDLFKQLREGCPVEDSGIQYIIR